jgi:hypothetical protein
MGGKDLDRNLPIETSVARPIDFAHPASTQFRRDLVRSKLRAGGNGHALQLYVHRSARSVLQCCGATVASRAAGGVASPVSVLTSGPAGGPSLLANSVLISTFWLAVGLISVSKV